MVRTSPALSRQLLPGVQGEAGATIAGGDPDIAAGPDQGDGPMAGGGDRPQQQSATLFRRGGCKGAIENREALMIQAKK